MLEEVVQALNLTANSIIVDATYGRGGHCAAIADRLDRKSRLIVIDRDAEAIRHAKSHAHKFGSIKIIHAPFSKLQVELENLGVFGKVDAILFDFGVSSPQLDQPGRGFSFSHDGPLDMRMDDGQEMTAHHWISDVEEKELVRVLRVYGEEKFARRIARAIKQALLDGPIETTGSLARIIDDAVPVKEKGKHPATRTFQAIRIVVNEELREIEEVLPQALEALAPGGRLVIISFHSLEDRLVKRFFRKESIGDPYPIDLPVTADMLKPRLKLVGKQVRASSEEVAANPRSRSAVMRIAQKVT
jgi:16S rRNA (cytosine1402-N4)-methyltransferase